MVNLCKIALGGFIATSIVSYCILLESSCANTDPNEGAGELVITQGSIGEGTQAGTRFLAPLMIDASAKLTANGTVEAQVLWVKNLCDEVLDCSSCPFAVSPHFNATTLRGKILLYDLDACEELYMCGANRLARTFGPTQLVALGRASSSISLDLVTPGYLQKVHRLGEARNDKPLDNDAGIPFPHFHGNQNSLALFLQNVFVEDSNVEIRAVLTPTAANPWRATLCGYYWKALGTLMILAHAGVTETAVSNWIGHVRTSGLRLDLAQLALATEAAAHGLMALIHHDPFLSFYWAAFPLGGMAFLVPSFL